MTGEKVDAPGGAALSAARAAARENHFMAPAPLTSQPATLEAHG
ncbi:hypothetical protein [Microbacterium sp. Marseille-Q6648]|nr:hypothetical protein [Microbacterium sp. Marseille-Q6648]